MDLDFFRDRCSLRFHVVEYFQLSSDSLLEASDVALHSHVGATLPLGVLRSPNCRETWVSRCSTSASWTSRPSEVPATGVEVRGHLPALCVGTAVRPRVWRP